jgi:hypothetical protein
MSKSPAIAAYSDTHVRPELTAEAVAGTKPSACDSEIARPVIERPSSFHSHEQSDEHPDKWSARSENPICEGSAAC